MRFPLVFLILGFATHAATACETWLEAYPQECQLQDRFRATRTRLWKEHGVASEEITEYRALRFIGRGSWEKSKARGNYDPSRIYEPAPQTWQAWDRGARHADGLAPLRSGFTNTEAIRDLHRQAVDREIMGRASVSLKGAAPGEIRHAWWQIPPGFTASCKDQKIHEKQARLFANFDLKDSHGEPLLRASLHPCSRVIERTGFAARERGFRNKYPNSPYSYGHVAYLPSHQVPEELTRLLDDVATQWRQIFDRNLPSGSTPVGVIADAQRRFVSIHPFGDGNGRTSRLFQDWMLRSLDLPFASSGDLQDDLGTPAAPYREAFLSSLIRNIELLERCLDEYQREAVSAGCRPVVWKATP